jgi:hypothetical protein
MGKDVGPSCITAFFRMRSKKRRSSSDRCAKHSASFRSASAASSGTNSVPLAGFCQLSRQAPCARQLLTTKAPHGVTLLRPRASCRQKIADNEVVGARADRTSHSLLVGAIVGVPRILGRCHREMMVRIRPFRHLYHADASRKRRTTVASSGGRRLLWIVVPAALGTPAIQNRSCTAIGTPYWSALSSASATFASAVAASAITSLTGERAVRASMRLSSADVTAADKSLPVHIRSSLITVRVMRFVPPAPWRRSVQSLLRSLAAPLPAESERL